MRRKQQPHPKLSSDKRLMTVITITGVLLLAFLVYVSA